MKKNRHYFRGLSRKWCESKSLSARKADNAIWHIQLGGLTKQSAILSASETMKNQTNRGGFPLAGIYHTCRAKILALGLILLSPFTRKTSKVVSGWLFVLLALISLGIIAPKAVFAQESDYYEDEYEDEDEDDDEDEDGDTESSRHDDEDKAYANVGKLEDSVVGISNFDGRFTLAATPAALFKKMAEMERDNAIMKLKIEREKLNLDLERQRAEMQKVGLSLQEEQAARARRAAEDAFLAEEDVLRRQLEVERAQAEIDRQQQENELNRRILDKISTADLSDPEQVSAVAQLLAFAPGATTTLPAVVREQLAFNNRARGDTVEAASPETLESKFTIRSIVGAGGQFTANLENNNTKAIARLKHGSSLEGWMVYNVSRDSVVFVRDGEMQTISMK